ncbi:MAG: Thymidylate kinase [uncultured Lysobacter sp.]|uniref:Thymidylate kinase n=1 Tax=uncultured Lysobacter sp. TaxID=271060 RepID=A0A6J4KTQ4_9GAMM|nr:MAG: Thymidylate kinase [uncultured Lysobacter sp.]
MLDFVPASPAGDFNSPAYSPALPVRHKPEFTGSAREYFGIWFVNLLLSVLTLGIYSAWAKVRTERYFYGNTRLAGSTFHYLASPIAILKGRLVAYAVVIGLGVSSRFSPGVYAVLLLGVFALMPALMVWSMRFRARNSAWRGLSFRFDSGAGEAYGPFLLWVWLSSLTATLLYPSMKRRQHEFVVEGHRYGVKRFTFHGISGKYYAPYLIAVGSVVGAGILAAVGFGLASASGAFDKSALNAGGIGAIVLLYLGFIGLVIFLRVRYVNLMWNSAQLAGNRFESTLRARDLMWIYASNLVAIVCTFGLAVPWAMVRLARYRAANFSMTTTGDLDEFAAASERRTGAMGYELVDALDTGVDIGL